MLHEQLGAAVVSAPPEMLGQVLLRVVLRGFQLEGFSLSMWMRRNKSKYFCAMFSNLKIGFKDRLPFNVAVLIWGSLKKKKSYCHELMLCNVSVNSMIGLYGFCEGQGEEKLLSADLQLI